MADDTTEPILLAPPNGGMGGNSQGKAHPVKSKVRGASVVLPTGSLVPQHAVLFPIPQSWELMAQPMSWQSGHSLFRQSWKIPSHRHRTTTNTYM